MAHLSYDLVLEATTTIAVADYVPSGARTGFVPFSTALRSDGSAIQTGDTFWYSAWGVDASDNPTGQYEAGMGTWTAIGAIARTTVLRSSNANAAVNWGAGTKLIAISALAPKLLQLEPDNTLPLPSSNGSAGFPPGSLRLFAGAFATQLRPEWSTQSSSKRRALQDNLAEHSSFIYVPNNGVTIGLNIGGAWTSGGTVSHPTVSASAPAIINQQKRTRWANVVTTTNQTLGLHTLTAEKRFWRGNGVGLGGFTFYARFIIGLWPAATVRLFVGLSDQNTSPVAADLLAGSLAAFTHDTTEAATVLNFTTRNGTTTTKVPLTLPAPLAAGEGYEAWITSAPNGSVIGYRLVRINTGQVVVDSNTTTTMPLNAALLGPTIQMSNGTANIAVTTTALDCAGSVTQSDR